LHDDPADRFIAALSLRHSATLVTSDDKLIGWAARTKGAQAMDAKT
jgi:PIN domain nuclease of toxin-antitoxin system